MGSYMETKYKAGQTVYVNVNDMGKGGRKTIEAKIEYVMPAYVIEDDENYLEFREEYVYETFEEAQKNNDW